MYNLINATELIGYVLGTLVLALALYRSRTIPRVLAVLLAVAILGRTALAGIYPGVVIADVVYVLVFGYVGQRVLRMSDQEWEHTSP